MLLSEHSCCLLTTHPKRRPESKGEGDPTPTLRNVRTICTPRVSNKRCVIIGIDQPYFGRVAHGTCWFAISSDAKPLLPITRPKISSVAEHSAPSTSSACVSIIAIVAAHDGRNDVEASGVAIDGSNPAIADLLPRRLRSCIAYHLSTNTTALIPLPRYRFSSSRPYPRCKAVSSVMAPVRHRRQAHQPNRCLIRQIGNLNHPSQTK